MNMKRWYGVICGIFACGMLTLVPMDAQARFFRVSMVPNGSQIGCILCHHSPGGGDARNAFGKEVEKLVTPGGMEAFWGPELAAKDSDGDDFTNGQELGDPDGNWQPGDPDPDVAFTLPGDASSHPEGTPAVDDSFVAILLGENEAPNPVDTGAYGVAIFKLHADGTTLDYILQVFNIEGVSASHIHTGAAGVAGGVLYPLEAPVTGMSSGSITINAADAAKFKDGSLYVNVHTSAHGGGEIRGQIEDKGIQFKAHLTGDQEAPNPVNTTATGDAQVYVSEDWSTVEWTLKVFGFTNTITAAHFHNGAPGVAGGVIIPIASGAFTITSGSAALTMDQLKLFLSDNVYVNVHTNVNGGGEIRGQVMYDAEFPVPNPSSAGDWTLYR
ncbi:MAG: CHRD domain-containing protein [bacterium]|nr:CHRD domain-containing protein [bacterium]